VPRAALVGMLRNSDLASLSSEVRAEIAGLQDSAFDFMNQVSLVHDVRPDVVFCGHWPAATFERRPSQPVVIDLAGPHLLERHYQGTPDHAGATRAKLHAVSNADHFIVSGAKQRLYFLSFLLRARVEQPEKRTITIHMPLSPQVPERRDLSDLTGFPRFVFAGVFLPWQDPSAALEQTAAALSVRGRGSLTLIGGPHPNYPIAPGVYADMFSKLSKLPFVRALPMLPYSEFVTELSHADVAVDLMRWNIERELAMTIRSTTYLWSGVPVIYNDYADLGDLIRAHDSGWTPSPSDRGALARVLDEVFDNPQIVAAKSTRARQLAREVFSWDRAVTPLLAALGDVSRAPRYAVDVDLTFPENAALSVLEDRALEQHFLSRIDGLSRVECCLATHARDQRDLQPITMSLYQVEADGAGRSAPRKLLVCKRIPRDSIQNNEWHALEVEPILDSAGRTFVLLIESEARREDESISPWAFAARPFPLLGLFRGGRPLDRMSLCLRTVSSLRSDP
jgi:glycosyltransferase involved in cell wall biosynthesis